MPKLIVVTREGEEREIMGEAGLSVMEVTIAGED
jgi:2Fe-2S ferredoxin